MLRYSLLVGITLSGTVFCSEHVVQRAAFPQPNAESSSPAVNTHAVAADFQLEYARLLKLAPFILSLCEKLASMDIDFLIRLLMHIWPGKDNEPSASGLLIFNSVQGVFLEKVLQMNYGSTGSGFIKSCNFPPILQEILLINYAACCKRETNKALSGASGQMAAGTVTTQLTHALSQMPADRRTSLKTSLEHTARPCELINEGNACFINSVVQALAVLTKLSQCMRNNMFYNWNSFAAEYKELMAQMEGGYDYRRTHTIFCSKSFALMHNTSDRLQHDAHEYLLQLIDHVAEADVHDLVKNTRAKNPDQSSKTVNAISSLFCINTRNVLVNHQANFLSTSTPEYHMSLDLPIESEDDVSLYECLKHYFTGSVPDYELPDKRRVEMEKRVNIQALSDYVVISLKRNHYNRERQQLQLMSSKIAFPLKGLSFKDYYDPREKLLESVDYELAAFIMHAGTAQNGHYIAFVNKNDRWFLCDDAHILEVPGQTIDAISSDGVYNGIYKKMIPVLFIYQRSAPVRVQAQTGPSNAVRSTNNYLYRENERSLGDGLPDVMPLFARDTNRGQNGFPNQSRGQEETRRAAIIQAIEELLRDVPGEHSKVRSLLRQARSDLLDMSSSIDMLRERAILLQEELESVQKQAYIAQSDLAAFKKILREMNNGI